MTGAAAPARAPFAGRIRERSFLPLAFAVSAGVHGLVYLAGRAKPRVARPPVELDLTASGHVALLQPPRRAAPAAAPRPAPARPEKEWVRSQTKAAPLPDRSKASAPPPDEQPAPPAAAPGEYGVGDGSDTRMISRLPQLKNLNDLRAILRRFYPEAERLRGDKGTVVIDLHVDAEGRVNAVDVVRSATPGFDEAARKVGLLLRFTPTFVGTQKVPVKLRQAIEFNLAQ